jgi:DNA (cytosine-5)-methyltransferase 1
MIRLFEAFSGYGGASFALKKAKIDYQLIGWSDIKKAAIKCFERNHYGKNYGDITQIDWESVPDFDLITGGFPCQDISSAGLQDLSKGRSILVYELIKALKIKQPKYFLFENVSAIEHEQFKPFLSHVESELRKAGYSVYRKCLNSKDFGVPQNRERVWFVGFRNDIAPEFGFMPWPMEVKLEKRLKDLLDSDVPEKYFLSEKQMLKISALLADTKEDEQVELSRYGTHVFNGVPETSPCLFGIGESDVARIKVNNATKSGFVYAYEGDGIRLDNSDSKTGRGRIQDQKCPTLLASGNGGVAVPNKCIELTHDQHMGERVYSAQPCAECQRGAARGGIYAVNYSEPQRLNVGLRIRRLTPKECFRLMGFADGEIDLSGLSDSELYNIAGNGWDVNLVSMIFKRMF